MTDRSRGNEFGPMLRRHRYLAGLTQEMLAHASGVALRTISDLERGRVMRPHRQTITLLAAALGLSEPDRARFLAGIVGAAPADGMAGGGTAGDGAPSATGAASGERAVPVGPWPVPGFTGRDAELANLTGWLRDDSAVTLVISGSPGVGKTALAAQWGSQVAGRFPGGCVLLNLHGHGSRAPMPTLEALTRLLRVIGIAPDRIPADVEEAAGLWQQRTAGAPVLLVLDDARDAAQVRPLIGAGVRSVTVITCRRRLPGLVVSHAARAMNLGVLARPDSIALIGALAGADPERMRDGMSALAAACADLPLALRIAAAHLTTKPDLSPRGLAASISDSEGLTALTIAGDDDATVASTFALSYQDLSGPARRMFQLLGLWPARDLGIEIAAALAGQTLAWTRTALDALASANLAEESPPGRYISHDLLRAFGRDQAAQAAQAGDADVLGAVGRVRAHLCRRAGAAARLLYPQLTRLPAAEYPAGQADGAGFGDRAEAMAWLSAETAGILAVIQQAAADPQAPESSWLLADAMRGWFFHQRLMPQWRAACRAGLSAAERHSAGEPQAAMRLGLGVAAQCEGRYAEAIAEFEAAVLAADRAGWLECRAAAIGNLGTAHYQLGHMDKAAELYEIGLELNRTLGNLGGQAIRLGNLGGIHRTMKRPDQASECYRQAAELYRAVGSVEGEALMLINLGSVAVDRGEGAEALRLGGMALDLATTARSVPFRCSAYRLLAEAHRVLGEPDLAVSLARVALKESQSARDPRLTVDAMNVLADALRSNGDHGRAGGHAAEAARLASEIGYQDGYAYASRHSASGLPAPR